MAFVSGNVLDANIPAGARLYWENTPENRNISPNKENISLIKSKGKERGREDLCFSSENTNCTVLIF